MNTIRIRLSFWMAVGLVAPSAACLGQPPAHAPQTRGWLPLTDAPAIRVELDASQTVFYAADCLRAELARLFNVGASIHRGDQVPGATATSIFLTNTPDRGFATRFPQLRNGLPPSPDGYLLGVLPDDRSVVVVGDGRMGVIRGVFALSQLAAGQGHRRGWPGMIVSDAPELPMRFTRDILIDGKRPEGLTPQETLSAGLDWWARWGLNHALIPGSLIGGKTPDLQRARWFVDEAHRRGMRVGASLGGRNLCATDAEMMAEYLSRARRLLDLGCDFLLVLFDDLPCSRFDGHCPKCIEVFGGSLAAEQRHVIEAIQQVMSEYDGDRKLIWCPTYYSVGMTGYIRATEDADEYFTILGRSPQVRSSWMFHCAFDPEFAACLDGKGLTRRVWWYNGIRTYYYMVARHFDGNDAWGPPLRIPGLKDFESFFSPFENGWLMPGFARADASLHRCVSPLVPASRDAQGRTVISPASWQALRELPERADGIYFCGSTTPYHIALAGVFAAHPRSFDQDRAARAVIESLFTSEGAGHALAWQNAYARAQILLARAQGSPLTGPSLDETNGLTAKMAEMEAHLRRCIAAGRSALPRPFLQRLLDAMHDWRAQVQSIAQGRHPPQ